ncbi:MAG TPA: amidase [Nitriliruptorales bacterium]|nr:amidase [Nitriliruptorales bacterium]
MVHGLTFASALEQARLIRDRAVSSRELVELYLARIEQHDPELGSYVDVMAEQAQTLAAEKDERTATGEELPPFHGVPVAIKELALLAGRRATFGTVSMKDFVAPFDDEVVARLKRAGMVPLGKTNVPELGTLPTSESLLLGPARNPWDPQRTPGGSSGGAAAALAGGLCPVAQGSDGAGSLRIPASCCGVYTLKPSRHRVSNAPLFISDLGPALSVRGMLTRTVADTAAFLDVLAGYVPGDPCRLPAPERPFAELATRPPPRLRVGVLSSNPIGHLSAETRAAVDTATAALEEVGHETFAVDVDVGDDVIEAFETVWAALFAVQPFPSDSLEPFNRWLVGRGHGTPVADVMAAEWRLRLVSRDLTARFHGEFDVMLAPVLSELPLQVGAYRDREPELIWEHLKTYVVAVTPLVNAAGLPAAGLPLHHDDVSGMPVGVQLVGRLAEEATLLQVSAQLEQVRPWVQRRPPGLG